MMEAHLGLTTRDKCGKPVKERLDILAVTRMGETLYNRKIKATNHSYRGPT